MQHHAGLDILLLLQDAILQELLNAELKLLVHSILLEVPAKHPELLHVIAAQIVELRHGRRDASNDGGEGDHGKEQHCDGEHPLVHVFGAHVHGGRRELRERPVKGCGVLVRGVLLQIAPSLDPVDIARNVRLLSNEVPQAGDHVVQEHNKEQKPEQGDHQKCKLTLDVLQHGIQDAPQLQHPKQPHHAHGLAQPESTPNPGVVEAVGAGHGEPLGDDHGQVKNEPRGQVLQRDLPVI
mmetsp:Transcript_15421/g.36387  ORF Transcript_15421/g.36387 Transcript_15421/m.36387 type:complete len:238 (+) Transcript_15421:720-1433(+)